MPKGLWIAFGLSALVLVGLHVEWRLHRSALRHIPIRIHVNGSRGKSSVTRLIAAMLRAHGIPTVAKTTGTTSRLILPDGSECPIPRDGPPNVKELITTMRRAAALGARAVVFECMAVSPDLQGVAERRIVRPTITVVTNARLDHTDVQGSTEEEIASSFPVIRGGVLVTADPVVAAVQEMGVRAGGGMVELAGARGVRESDRRHLGYLEHADNIGLALRVAELAGVPRAVAVRGLGLARPDPGVAAVIDLYHASGRWSLINLFAANDPDSMFRALAVVQEMFDEPLRPIVLYASRGDRSARASEFAHALSRRREEVSDVVLWGERTRAMARRVLALGMPPERVADAGSVSPEQLTGLLLQRMNGHRVVVGVGNIIGPAQALMEHLAEVAG